MTSFEHSIVKLDLLKSRIQHGKEASFNCLDSARTDSNVEIELKKHKKLMLLT